MLPPRPCVPSPPIRSIWARKLERRWCSIRGARHSHTIPTSTASSPVVACHPTVSGGSPAGPLSSCPCAYSHGCSGDVSSNNSQQCIVVASCGSSASTPRSPILPSSPGGSCRYAHVNGSCMRSARSRDPRRCSPIRVIHRRRYRLRRLEEICRQKVRRVTQTKTACRQSGGGERGETACGFWSALFGLDKEEVISGS